MSHKDDLEIEDLELLKKIRAMKTQVKMIRMDNAAKNRLLQKSNEQEKSDIDFQYTAAGTLQQNGCIEQKFAALHGKVRSTLNLERITPGICCKLWAEYAAHVTDIENLNVNKSYEMSLFKKLYGKAPRFTSNIRVFGKMGIVFIYDKKIKAR